MSGQHCPGCGTAFLPDLRPACDCALRAREPQPQEEPEAETPVEPLGDPVFGHVASPQAEEPVLNDADLQLFDGPPGPGGSPSSYVPSDPDPSPQELSKSRRGRRLGLLAGAAGITALSALAAGVVLGLGHESGTPQAGGGAAESVEVEEPSSTSVSPSASRTPERASRGEKRSPSPTRTPSSSAAPSTSSSSSSAPPSSSTPEPTRTTPTQPSTSEATNPDDSPRVLRRGDHGDQVGELQLRLEQLQLYMGTAHGNYNSEVETAVSRFQQARAIDEELGVYGPATRSGVEAETTDPS